MSIVENYREFKKHRWQCVYGASVALQVHQRMIEGRGGIDVKAMINIKEEARAVADLDAEGESV